MSKLRLDISMSLDGFVTGPNPRFDEPLGDGGMQLHEWAFGLEAWRRPHGMDGGETNASTPVVEETLSNIGAVIMGRGMFGGGGGPWGDWEGWWGDEPPFHVPVFVLTNHARDPLQKDGGTSFTFVTGGIESALEQAREAAAGKDVSLAGGANVAQQYLAAGLLDEVQIAVVPVLLHDGTRLFDGLSSADVRLEQVGAVEAPTVTHLRYRVAK